MRHLVLCLMLIGCHKGDDAKDKEIAALKAQLAAKGTTENAPSLGAVKQQTPALVQPQNTPEVERPASQRPVEFLLERIDKEGQTPGSLIDLFDRADMPDNRSITYAHLEKNAARYIGRPWKFTGRVVEIIEKPGTVAARIALDWYGNHIMMVFGRFETDFVKGNTVDVIGYLAGNYSYESQAKWNITIPALAAHSMLKAGALRKMKAGAHQPRAVAEEDEE